MTMGSNLLHVACSECTVVGSVFTAIGPDVEMLVLMVQRLVPIAQRLILTVLFV